MRFGIAFHGDYSLWWYQTAFLSDLEGPKKGMPYDAAQNYDGKDTWWKKMGLDLKDLYGWWYGRLNCQFRITVTS